MAALEQIIPGRTPSTIEDPGGARIIFHLAGSTRRYGLVAKDTFTPASRTSDRYPDATSDRTYILGDDNSRAAIYYSDGNLHFREIHPGGIPIADTSTGAEPFKLQPNQWTAFPANGLSLLFGNTTDNRTTPAHVLEFSTDHRGIVHVELDGNQIQFTLPDTRTTTAIPEGEFYTVGKGSNEPNALQPSIIVSDNFVSKLNLGFVRLGTTIYVVDASTNGTYLFRR